MSPHLAQQPPPVLSQPLQQPQLQPPLQQPPVMATSMAQYGGGPPITQNGLGTHSPLMPAALVSPTQTITPPPHLAEGLSSRALQQTAAALTTAITSTAPQPQPQQEATSSEASQPQSEYSYAPPPPPVDDAIPLAQTEPAYEQSTATPAQVEPPAQEPPASVHACVVDEAEPPVQVEDVE